MMRTTAAMAFAAVLAIGARATAWTIGGEPPQLAGRVTAIHDGDTFHIGRTIIRVYGVDAPELETAYGPASREALTRAIGDRPVTCEDTHTRSHGRVVARCFNARHADLAQQLAREGWVVDWWIFSCGRYQADQDEARAARRGMFAYGVTPWRGRSSFDRRCGPYGRQLRGRDPAIGATHDDEERHP